MRSDRVSHYLPAWTGLPDVTSYLTTLFGGISSFFRPNAAAFLGPQVLLGAERAGFIPQRRYVNCQRTGRLRAHKPKSIASDRRRLRVRSGVMRYFDTRDQAMTIDHI